MATPEATREYLGLDSDNFTRSMAEALLQFEINEQMREKAYALGQKSSAGTITDQERQSLLELVELDELMALIQAQAKRFLAKQA